MPNESVMKLTDDWGHAEISPRDAIPAGSRGTWTLVYRAGANGIPVGGSLRIIPPVAGFCRWDVGKVTAFAEQPGVCLEVQTEHVQPATWHHSNYPAITVVVYGEAIRPGGLVRVVMGDLGGYVSGRFVRAQAQDFAMPGTFAVFVDPVGNARFALEQQKPGRYRPVSGELTVDVVAAAPHRFRLSLRHPPAPGAPAAATLTVEDRFENVVRNFAGTFRLDATTPIPGLPQSIELSPADCGHKSFTFAPPPTDAPIHIAASDWQHEIIGASNPLEPGFCGDEFQAYFGDLHVMTGQNAHHSHAMMVGGTDEAIRYARDDRGLDFTAVTNPGGQWDVDAQIFAKHHAPHKFVTMPAREFGFHSGHKNAYLLDESQDMPAAKSAEELFESLRERAAIVIGHHPNTHSETDPYVGWGHHNLDVIDPQLEPVIEICQDRGSFEHDAVGTDNVHFGGFGSSAQDALARGHRLGFVGGTDTHRARPASSRTNLSGLDADDFLGGGLTCVLAPELTREAIFEAIRARRCYATNGARILLDVRLNGHRMGEEFKSDTASPRTLTVRAAGTADIARAVVVRNGQDVHAHPGSGRSFEMEWTDPTPLTDVVTPDGWVYYYVRLVQADGHIAWSSPVWVDWEDA